MFGAAQKHFYYCFFNSAAFNVMVSGGRGEFMLSSQSGTECLSFRNVMRS